MFVYKNEVYDRLGIWNKDLTHKIKTSPNIPGTLTHNPRDGHPPNQPKDSYPPSQGKLPTIQWMGTHYTHDGQIHLPGWLSNLPRMVTVQPRMVTNHSKDGHPPSLRLSTTIQRTVPTIQKELFYKPTIN